MTTLEARLDRLERANRRQRLAIVALFVALTAAGLVGFSAQNAVPDLIEAREFRVVNAAGKTVVKLDAQRDVGSITTYSQDGDSTSYLTTVEDVDVFNVYDDEGNRQIVLQGNPGAPVFVMHSSGGDKRAELNGSGPGASLALWNKNANLAAQLGASSEGKGALWTFAEGKQTVYVGGHRTQDSGLIQVKGPEERTLVDLSGEPKGPDNGLLGTITAYGTNGETLATITGDKDNVGRVVSRRMVVIAENGDPLVDIADTFRQNTGDIGTVVTYSDNGTVLTQLGANRDKTGRISIHDAKGQELGAMSANGTGEVGRLNLMSQAGRTLVDLGSGSDNQGNNVGTVRTYNDEGRNLITLAASTDGSPRLSVNDRQGRKSVILDSGPHGGSIDTFAENGRGLVSLDAVNDGETDAPSIGRVRTFVGREDSTNKSPLLISLSATPENRGSVRIADGQGKTSALLTSDQHGGQLHMFDPQERPTLILGTTPTESGAVSLFNSGKVTVNMGANVDFLAGEDKAGDGDGFLILSDRNGTRRAVMGVMGDGRAEVQILDAERQILSVLTSDDQKNGAVKYFDRVTGEFVTLKPQP